MPDAKRDSRILQITVTMFSSTCSMTQRPLFPDQPFEIFNASSAWSEMYFAFSCTGDRECFQLTSRQLYQEGGGILPEKLGWGVRPAFQKIPRAFVDGVIDNAMKKYLLLTKHT